MSEIRRSLMNVLASGGGGGTMESGTIVPTSGDSLTIPVTALHSEVYVCHEDYEWGMSLADAPFGTNKRVCVYANNDFGFVAQCIVNYAGTVTTGTCDCIAHWGGASTGNANTVVFSDTEITFDVLRVGGVTRDFLIGQTYKWYAW